METTIFHNKMPRLQNDYITTRIWKDGWDKEQGERINKCVLLSISADQTVFLKNFPTEKNIKMGKHGWKTPLRICLKETEKGANLIFEKVFLFECVWPFCRIGAKRVNNLLNRKTYNQIQEISSVNLNELLNHRIKTNC